MTGRASGNIAIRFAALLCFSVLSSLVGTVSAKGLYFPSDTNTWATVNPEQVGWDPDKLSSALTLAGDRRSSGVVILHNGRIMAERYWEQNNLSNQYANYIQGRDSANRAIEDVASVQKGVVAVLVGIAQERGLLNIEEPVSTYLGSGWSDSSSNQEQAITIRHLMSMNSGLATDMKFDSDAGSTWLYNTPAYHYVMRVIERVTGFDRNEVTQRWLAAPMGLKHSAWTPRPWANSAIGAGYSTTARELAMFGLMIQANGRWQDKTIVADTDYLQAMLSPSQTLNPAYGFLWWINGEEFLLGGGPRARRMNRTLIPAAPNDLVAMLGAADRKLYLVPSLNLVITRLGDAGGESGSSFNDAFWSAVMAAKK